MKTLHLRFVLKSDASFGRGDGLAGLVDSEVQHDDLGCPFLNGKEIKGILAQECAGVLAGLPAAKKPRWEKAAARLFGRPGSALEDTAWLVFGDARLPDDLRARLAWDRDRWLEQQRKLLDKQFDERKQSLLADFRAQVLETLTTIRQQTAIEEKTGVAKDHSLRATRVVIREAPFVARLEYRPSGELPAGELQAAEADDLALLAACVAAFRRAGSGRNRGRGKLQAELLDEENQAMQSAYLQRFIQEVQS